MADSKQSPNDYRDPYWSELAANSEKKYDLPDGVLQQIILSGEKSNNDQTNKYGTKTKIRSIKSIRWDG